MTEQSRKWTRGTDTVMGTREEAETKLLSAWERFCEISQPRMVPTGRKAAAQREAERHEVRNRMVEAGALMAWHLYNQEPCEAGMSPRQLAERVRELEGLLRESLKWVEAANRMRVEHRIGGAHSERLACLLIDIDNALRTEPRT